MDVIMPQLGETVAEGKVSTWFKSAGDQVDVGENLFEIETDKVTMEVQALTSGILSEIRVKTGDTVPVGAVVAVIGEKGAAALTGAPDDAPGKVPSSPFVAAPTGSNGAAAPRATVSEGQRAPLREGTGLPSARPPSTPFKLAPFAETNTPTGRYGRAGGPLGVRITPLARRLIAQNGLDAGDLAASAKSKGAWRIGRAEVEAALRQGGSRPAAEAHAGVAPARQARAPSPEARGESVAFNNVRRQTGQRLQQSWQTIPHVLQATEVDFAGVEKARSARKAEFKTRHGVSLTYLPFIARAVCMAIADYPRVNARLEGEGLTIGSEVNLGIAVDLSHNGLVVPVVRNADELTAAGLAKTIARQADKARSGKLAPDDFAGATYTISNNGAFGTLFTAPIVNPPQVAILSTDAVRKRPVVIEADDGDSIAIRPVGVVAQSFDHRAFDGAYSAAFLARLKVVLETHDWAGELA